MKFKNIGLIYMRVFKLCMIKELDTIIQWSRLKKEPNCLEMKNIIRNKNLMLP